MAEINIRNNWRKKSSSLAPC